MRTDWNTRNYGFMVISGLRRRWRRAKFGRELVFLANAMWDASGLPMRPMR